MTENERVRNLIALGYSGREAQFLCLAALHSGYFVRRQFLSFAGREPGKIDSNLADKAVGNGHARAIVFRHKRPVYHLHSKPLYEALGEDDNRNRRTHHVFTIKNRLMGLDFILQNRNYEFLGTEREKVLFFREALNIEVEHLPTKFYRSRKTAQITERYFVDKFPIAVSNVAGAAAPVVHFCYVDEGLHSTSGFEKYLQQYGRLFARVPSLQLIYIASFQDQFDASRRAFERSVVRGHAGRPIDPLIMRLLAHFRDLELYGKRELKGFTQARLIQFREDRQAFAGERYQALFARWNVGGDMAVLKEMCPESVKDSTSMAQFLTCRLPFSYDLFGTLANGNWRQCG